jgi:hypothetical protein
MLLYGLGLWVIGFGASGGLLEDLLEYWGEPDAIYTIAGCSGDMNYTQHRYIGDIAMLHCSIHLQLNPITMNLQI